MAGCSEHEDLEAPGLEFRTHTVAGGYASITWEIVAINP